MRSQRVGHDLATEQQPSLFIVEVGGQSHHHPPLCVGLSAPYDLSLDAILSTQFVWEITEGEAKEEIWSAVHHLFFIFTSFTYRKYQQVRQDIVWSKDLKRVLWLELSRAWEESLRLVRRQRDASYRQLFPEENFLLPKAAYIHVKN